MYPYSKALNDEFRTFNLVLRLSFDALDEYSSTLPNTRRGFEVWDHADQFILEAFNEQLNRIVDGCLSAILLRVGPWPFPFKMTKWGRRETLRYLEKVFGFKSSDLPGWCSLAAVAADANASKHRTGLFWENDVNGTAWHVGLVSLHRKDLASRVRGTKRWLKALGIATRMT